MVNILGLQWFPNSFWDIQVSPLHSLAVNQPQRRWVAPAFISPWASSVAQQLMTLIEPFPDFHRMIGPCQGGVPPKLANMWPFCLFVCIKKRLTGLFAQFKHPTMTLIFNVDFTNAVCSGLLFRPLYLSIPCGRLGELSPGWGGSWMMITSEKVGRGRFSIVKKHPKLVWGSTKLV